MSESTAEEAAIQQFLLLLKNSKGKAAAMVITQALSAPALFHFGELLAHPNVVALEPTADKPVFDQLRIFAYGTLADYKSTPGLPPLTDVQLTKLKQLTVVSLAIEAKVIPYATLQQHLELSNVRELEDLIIDCIYAGLVKGKLDQRDKHFQVDFSIARDLRPGQVEKMIATLNQWCEQSELLLRTVDEQIAISTKAHDANRAHKKEFEDRIEALKINLKQQLEAEGGGALEGMMFDDERARKKSGAAKMRGGMGGRKGPGGGGPGGPGGKRGFLRTDWFG